MGTLLAASIIGLLLLKYFYKLRVLSFYSKVGGESVSHVYVKGEDGLEEISVVKRVRFEGERKVFEFKKLRYELEGKEFCPLAMDLEEEIEEYSSDGHLERGLKK